MRGIASIIAIACVASASLFAPFQHVHDPGRAVEHVAKYHHGGLALHLHIAGWAAADQSWQAADDSSHLLQWFRANEIKPFRYAVAVVTTVAEFHFDTTFLPRRVPVESLIGDSPPLVRPAPRGPPV